MFCLLVATSGAEKGTQPTAALLLVLINRNLLHKADKAMLLQQLLSGFLGSQVCCDKYATCDGFNNKPLQMTDQQRHLLVQLCQQPLYSTISTVIAVKDMRIAPARRSALGRAHTADPDAQPPWQNGLDPCLRNHTEAAKQHNDKVSAVFSVTGNSLADHMCRVALLASVLLISVCP